MSTTMTVRLEEDIKTRLEQLSGVTNRSKSFLAAVAIKEFVEHNEWQLKEIADALSEADAGEFASDEDVQQVFEKWNVKD